jgi:hypothetical protein
VPRTGTRRDRHLVGRHADVSAEALCARFFRGLGHEQLREIAGLLLEQTRRRLHAQGVTLPGDTAAVDVSGGRLHITASAAETDAAPPAGSVTGADLAAAHETALDALAAVLKTTGLRGAGWRSSPETSGWHRPHAALIRHG